MAYDFPFKMDDLTNKAEGEAAIVRRVIASTTTRSLARYRNA
jgi:hypothetical protein